MNAEAPFGVPFPQRVPQAEAAVFDPAEAAPDVKAGGKAVRHDLFGKAVSRHGYGAGIFVFKLRFPVMKLLYKSVHRTENIRRLKARHHGGKAELLRQEGKSPGADDGRHMPRAEKAVHLKAPPA